MFVGALALPDALKSSEVSVVFDNTGTNAPGSDEIRIRVMLLNRELENAKPDPQLMRDIAQASGGAVLERPADALEFLDQQRRAAAAELVPYSEPVWNEPWLWAVLLGIFSAEWTLRRFAAG